MDGNYLPITYGDENPNTHFLGHYSISRYVSKLPSIGSLGRAFKLALSSHTPYFMANIHGRFLRGQGAQLDEWLAHLPDLASLWGTLTIVRQDALPIQPGSGRCSLNPEPCWT